MYSGVCLHKQQQQLNKLLMSFREIVVPVILVIIVWIEIFYLRLIVIEKNKPKTEVQKRVQKNLIVLGVIATLSILGSFLS